MTATWLTIFASWVVLAAVDLALAVAFDSVVLALVGAWCATFAIQALHKANVERRFRHVEDVAKRELRLMERCQECGNRVGFEAHREQLQCACAEMLRIAKE